MKDKTAIFTGHRNIPANLVSKIEEEVKKTVVDLIKQGVIYYGNGGARGFDLLSAKCILELKIVYPQIKLIMVLPCKNQTKLWNNYDINKYLFILNNADKITYTSLDYTETCMLARNDYLIRNSSHCIAYLTNNNSGTAYTIRKASLRGLSVYNIAEKI